MSAFSNGYEWDCWSAKWCHRCVHYETCPIWSDAMLLNVKPEQWINEDPGNLYDRYECTEFSLDESY